MKVRLGFVSNSSSTSFLVFGVSMDEKTLDTNLRQILINNGKTIDEVNTKYSKKYYYVEDMFRDIVIEIHGCDEDAYYDGDYEITMHSPSEKDGIYIGVQPSEMRESETLHEFKGRIKDKLTRFGLSVEGLKLDWLYGEESDC